MINKVKYMIGKHLNISVCLLFALFSCLIILPYLHGPAYIHQEGWDGRFHMARVAESYLNLSHGHLDQAIPSVMTKTFRIIWISTKSFLSVDNYASRGALAHNLWQCVRWLFGIYFFNLFFNVYVNVHLYIKNNKKSFHCSIK